MIRLIISVNEFICENTSMADCSKPKPDLRMNSRGGKRCWFKEVPALGVSVTSNSGAQTVGRDRSVGGPRGTSGPREASSNKHLFED